MPVTSRDVTMKAVRLALPETAMSQTLTRPADIEADAGLTAADLVEMFGPIPLRRIVTDPPPGTATEADLEDIVDRQGRLCELIDGVLVEKTMSWWEAYLETEIGRLLANFVRPRNLGLVLSSAGPIKLFSGRIRMPDASFITWGRLPWKEIPREKSFALDVAPNLCVEVISPSNTKREMDRKLDDYFGRGVELVWYIDPRPKRVRVYTARDTSVELSEGDVLDGGTVLPGFSVALAELFAEPTAPPSA
jgi:Uma2 family endonuclease